MPKRRVDQVTQWQELTEKTNNDPILKRHRDWIEQKHHGFGDRPLHAMWKILLEPLDSPKLLEVGVYMGQVLSLWRLIKPEADISGITPLAATNDGFHQMPDVDYRAKIKEVHDEFNLKEPKIIKGYSTDPKVLKKLKPPYDLIYIDGGHDLPTATSDLQLYPPLVKPDGLLVVDDASFFHPFDTESDPTLWYTGLDAVGRALRETIEQDQEWKEIMQVGHVRVWRKR